jgi:hypothetical protein
MVETETVSFAAEPFRISIHEIGRYAGGARYKLDSRTETLAAEVVEQAGALADPVFTYALHTVESVDRQNRIFLAGGDHVEIPEEENDPKTVSLAAVVCTLGPNLEKKTQQLMADGDLLTAMFLDAAGVAVLEMLGGRARKHIKNKAFEAGLFTGCPFGPGYNNLPLDSQKKLFKHVDAEHIGVRLNESGVMLPMKSISFWLRITGDKKTAEDHGYKCRKCEMRNCIYRKEPPYT